jgi:WD40 repeat protein
VRNIFNAPGSASNWNKRIARFSVNGRFVAYTAEGDAGLVAFNLDQNSSTILVPHRLLYRGITAFNWSQQEDMLLVAIGRDIALVRSNGHIEWQRRLETRSLITDIVWHPTEKFYTVATDDTTVSSYETISGQLMASEMLETVSHPTPVRVEWSKDGFALVANVQKGNLVVLDPDTLKPRKSIPCGCVDFGWSPTRRELVASTQTKIAVFSDFGSKGREFQTPFEGAGPLIWMDENRILAAGPDSAVALREARGPKVLKTFLPPR